MNRRLADSGVAAVSVVTPYYWKLTQEALYRHYAAILEQARIPVLAYNIPGNTGLNLDPETIGRLYREAGLAGAKDSSGDWNNTSGYLRATGSDFTLLTGADELFCMGLESGAKGAISAPANVLTHVMAAVYRRYVNGNLEGARQAQRDWNRVTGLLSRLGGFPGSVKLACDTLTAPVGLPRPPVLPGDAVEMEKIMPELLSIAAAYEAG